MGKLKPSNIRQKRLTKEITFASLSLALGIIFLSLSYVIPGITIFLMIIIPFTSAYFALNSNYKGQLIYLASLLAIAFIDFQGGFFDLLPNALIGLVYGNALKIFKANFLTYLVTLLATFVIETVLLIPVNIIFKVNMVEIYAALFNIDIEIFKNIFLLFMFLLSLIQTLITFVCITNELPKLNIKNKEIPSNKKIEYPLLVVFFAIFYTLSTLYLKSLSYVVLMVLILILSYYILDMILTSSKNIKTLFICSIVLGAIASIVSIILLPKNFIELSMFILYLPSIVLSFFVLIYKCEKRDVTSSYKEESKDLLELKKGLDDGSIS